ncbi:hypothetical protein K437DRAFT_229791 [Tilletiaria anomala UBC 951]|uniref:U4/U6 snRNA-associated-splicing factor PRP24 n=1 Tax=Tilletiaria anomala (strain ATCC 24038 / CBS 436.72 / UBC 951) TaxID=1037660 RepID=A0A066VCT4_TILAU|nr:uncharacterized protein K437DRAFT_229791 [Tilletiaria anomala UBC 951]KDN36355.1 hypothetical protein K437DRAFT_229791 [Tilletiaria anomala UBC 951]
MDVCDECSTPRTQDPVQWGTGLRGGPIIEPDGTYASTSLPRIPTRSEAEQAGLLETYETILGESAVRDALREAYSRVAYHLAESQTSWKAYLAFEMAYFRHDRSAARKEVVKQAFISRLRVPHMQHDHTAQQLSAFVSNFLNPEEYEPIMAAASRGAAAAKEAFTQRERYEDRFAAAKFKGDFQAVKPYLRWQVSQKPLDLLMTSALYKRAIFAFAQPPTLTEDEIRNPPTPHFQAEVREGRAGKANYAAAKEAERQELAAKAAQAEGLWVDYLSFLALHKATPSEVLDSCAQAVRSLPGSGKTWAIYLRNLARLHRGEVEVAEAFNRALSNGQCLQDPASWADLLLGRCDAEKEFVLLAAAAEQGVSVENVVLAGDVARFSQVFGVIEFCMQLAPTQPLPDPEVRLERFASGWCERCGAETAALADELWEKTLTAQPKNAKAWHEAAQYCIRTSQAAKARSLFKQVSGKPGLENKAQLLDAWLAFEHVYGGCAEIEYAARKVKEETERAWDAYYRSYAAQQGQYNQLAQLPPKASSSSANGKRCAEDVLDPAEASTSFHAMRTSNEASKKSKALQKGPTKDRENCSVLVSRLPQGSTEQDLRVLFRGCGEIVDISGPKALTDGTAAALVEFSDRGAIGAARTRDKKQVRGSEVAVHIGHECTLYVTNFPEATADEDIRSRFGKYGSIFDVRWPSKKYASRRRFCYVELTSPEAARLALAEDGQHLSELNTLQVALSDPERRKMRSDANVNEREVYITGIHPNAVEAEVRALFELHGTVEGFRMPLSDAGKAKGIGFVDYRTPLEAQKAVAQVNGSTYQGKALKVSIANKPSGPVRVGGGQGFRSRSIRLHGLPDDAQEALIQQLVEKVVGAGAVKKVEWNPGPESRGEAIVEMVDPAASHSSGSES